MDIMRRIDQVIAATADAYVKELQAEIARLREALVEERAHRNAVYVIAELPQDVDDSYRAEAREELVFEGLLPPA